MQLAANVNYAIRSAQPQTVEIDSGDTVGAMTGPTHEAVAVRVNNVRRGRAKVTFCTGSLSIASPSPSARRKLRRQCGRSR